MYEDEEIPELCPECRTYTIVQSSDRSYEYCTKCGLITRASSCYVAGKPIILPYGLLII